MFLNSHGTFDVNSSVIFIGIQVEDHVPLPASVVTIHNFSIVLESFCVGRFLMRLSCDDSPLIVTGNIIGILTFDGAIFISMQFYANSTRNADRNLREMGATLESFVSIEVYPALAA